MSTNAKRDDSTAMRFGQRLGRGVAAVLRLEKALWSSLSRVGIPEVIVTAVKWIARVAILGAGAFFAAWGLLYVLAVVCFLAIAIGFVTNPGVERALRGSQLVHFDEASEDAFGKSESGWMSGPQGYGYYENGLKQQ
ncbi:Uncharacterized protein ALO42_02592 [Pseudomonas syringae pv. atrofaciens]|uniref:DUF3742 domain-containing protein n=2 Tax=Pseudomonas syringae TaxID=317 RepID=A0A1X4BKV8_PSESF|nr:MULTISPECIES: DUF3742 family protein [Pseudomonas syringae group]AKF53340.1 Protein of unknown function (DUF3742) [Pseudomonas syringae pv. syringae HS191]APP99970.1 hypothetical protein PsaNZ45_25385 [Pseudomonas syringae pv. actinidiae]ASD54140.1 hypothetical protein [Pseudomonas syringae pv. actinidiae]AVX24729.1 DUF3742 domain-containing protein [Pseudomonas syringae pv. atrofaciens]KPW07784.1 Uncharacterized protein ALO42_02592 [Pseudomonas syringae pv. atrofaciens]